MPSHTFVVLAYKVSPYLEECIKSTLNQSINTNVVIATSTPNDYIKSLANKYKLEIIENKSGMGIAQDFDFALKAATTTLVTIAHQDDYYDYDYVKEMIKHYKKNALIIFSNYYEIRDNQKVIHNRNLKIKNILLTPLKIKGLNSCYFIKRLTLCLGDPICCPAVTFNTLKMPKEVFTSDFKCNVDWNAWEKLSKKKGSFVLVNKRLMGHRVHSASTTTKMINQNNVRTNEDYIMLKRFWITPMAKLINHFYKKALDSNNV